MMVNERGDVGEERRMKASYMTKVIDYFSSTQLLDEDRKDWHVEPPDTRTRRLD
jgi:hypothetical protein